jgi:hypothetical protein
VRFDLEKTQGVARVQRKGRTLAAIPKNEWMVVDEMTTGLTLTNWMEMYSARPTQIPDG